MIYFIQMKRVKLREGGPIKIGYTSDPDLNTRLTELQCGNPYPLRVLGVIADGDRIREAELHCLFKQQRMRGEWFKSTAKLKGFIKQNSTGYLLGKADVVISTTTANFISPENQYLAAQRARPQRTGTKASCRSNPHTGPEFHKHDAEIFKLLTEPFHPPCNKRTFSAFDMKFWCQKTNGSISLHAYYRERARREAQSNTQ